MKNKIKAHWKKYKAIYLSVGAAVISIAGAVALAKADSYDIEEPEDHRSDFDELKELYRLGGEKSPLVYELSEREVDSYNRVVDDLENGGLQEVQPGQYRLQLESADNDDMEVYNQVAGMTNDYIAANAEGGLPPEQFDDTKTRLERI